MTVVCYRDGVMAADSLSISGNTVSCFCKKIACNYKNGSVIGVSGGSVDCGAVLRWFVEDVGDFESFPKVLNVCGIIVDGSTVKHFDESGNWYEMEGPFFAVGCGADIAIGAMGFGANAVEAVNIANQYNVGCGGPVQIENIRSTMKEAAE